MNTPVIELAGIGKCYWIHPARPFLLRELALRAMGRGTRAKPLWALNRVDLRVARGEAVGVVGHNGAGKSTLLGIVAGTVFPTTGTVRVSGRVCALLELGAGFHPDLTGRENIYLNASLLGLNREQTEARFDTIVEFSELGAFLDMPMWQYSSGMWMRLGFAVASVAEPDILIIDEILAVGDSDFRKKCLGRIRELRQKQTTFLFVSHNADHIRFLCDRAVWIEHGVTKSQGPVADVLDAYEQSGGGGPKRSQA